MTQVEYKRMGKVFFTGERYQYSGTRIELNQFIVTGICAKCFHCGWNKSDKMLRCYKANVNIKIKVKECKGFLAIAEGIDVLLNKNQEAQGGKK